MEPLKRQVSEAFLLWVRVPLEALLETARDGGFPLFSNGFQTFLIHSKSRHFSIKRGQNVGTESPDHRQSEALARPPFHRTILLVAAKQQQVSGVLSEGGGL